MNYTSMYKIIDLFDIQRGDRLFVSSDIRRLFFLAIKNNEKPNLDKFIDALVERLGHTGTLIFPTYNWGFCKGESFDYYNTECKTGALGVAALKRSDFIRTKHPIYSFAVHGKDAGMLCNLDNKSSFGKDSPFNYFHEFHVKNLVIDLPYSKFFTYCHYVEEMSGNVSYRFMKNFTSNYIDKSGNISERTYSMLVRYLDNSTGADVITGLDSAAIGHDLETNGIIVRKSINGIPILLIDMYAAYPVIMDDIVNNKSRKICQHTGQYE